MRGTDLVRSILDLIDTIDQQDTIQNTVPQTSEPDGRFKQIFAILNAENTGPYTNTPNEIVSDADSVTTDAGGGVNGAKHPDDIRVKDPRGYE